MCVFQREYTHGLAYANTAPSLWTGTTRCLQLMFSLSGGGTPANPALYERDRPFIYHVQAPLCPCACARSYHNGPKLCMTLAHFLPFKSCFWVGTADVRSQTSTCVGAMGGGVRSDEAGAGTEYSRYGYQLGKLLSVFVKLEKKNNVLYDTWRFTFSSFLFLWLWCPEDFFNPPPDLWPPSFIFFKCLKGVECFCTD